METAEEATERDSRRSESGVLGLVEPASCSRASFSAGLPGRLAAMFIRGASGIDGTLPCVGQGGSAAPRAAGHAVLGLPGGGAELGMPCMASSAPDALAPNLHRGRACLSVAWRYPGR